MNLELAKIKSIHFVGIKGVAMTALAIIAKELGKKVSGSDVAEVFPTDATLNSHKIQYVRGFSPQNIPFEIDLVIYTGAHQGAENIEVKAANQRGIPSLSHGKALGLFMEGKRGISIAGSHGKTTTSAMIATILTEARLDPSYAIGCGEILNLHTPAHAGKGDYFVAEADEYATDPGRDATPRFMWQRPELLVITNIDFDHPDVYSNITEVQRAFVALTANVGKTVVCNSDDPATREIIPRIHKNIITYGTQNEPEYTLSNISVKNQRTLFQVRHTTSDLGVFSLSIAGRHNTLNATASLVSLLILGIPLEKIRTGLKTYTGTKRRLELIAAKNGKLLYDDYAHHPAEVVATLEAARSYHRKRRLVVIFQPHTYTRLLALLDKFAACFSQADIVVITDIYASAREEPIPEFSGYNLYELLKMKKKEVFFAPKKEDVLQYLGSSTRENDLIVTMGAGDIYTWLSSIVRVL